MRSLTAGGDTYVQGVGEAHEAGDGGVEQEVLGEVGGDLQTEPDVSVTSRRLNASCPTAPPSVKGRRKAWLTDGGGFPGSSEPE